MKIVEIFRFDFSEKKDSEKKLNKLFEKYGFPNLQVDLQNDYDGLWQVVNKRSRRVLFEAFHSAFVVFHKEDDEIKVSFTYEVYVDPSKCITFCDKIKKEEEDELQTN